MPTNKRLSLLAVIFTLLAACAPTSQNSGSTNPATPTPSPVVATAPMTLPLLPPYPTAAATPTSAFYQMQEVVIADPALAQSASADSFTPLAVSVVTDASQALVQYDASGWPTTIAIPTDRLYFALRCESPTKVWAGFFLPEDKVGDQPIFVANCTGKIELLVLHPEGVGHYFMVGQGSQTDENISQEGGISIKRWKMDTSGLSGQVVAWFNK